MPIVPPDDSIFSIGADGGEAPLGFMIDVSLLLAPVDLAGGAVSGTFWPVVLLGYSLAGERGLGCYG